MLLKMKAAKFVAALAMFISSVVPVAALNNATVSSAGGDCSGNSVMHCGAVSVSDFDNKLAHGDGVNSASELQHVYGSWGITAGTMSGVVSGYVTKSGSVVVGGKVVATGAESVGRDFVAGSHRDPRSGLWMRPTSVIFAQPSLTAWVHMTGGQFDWAVLDVCGNMVTGHRTPPPASVVCQSLTPRSSQGNAPLTVTYTAEAVSKNAHISAFRFNFDNGDVVTKPAIQQSGGRATAQATETFNQPGKDVHPFVLVESSLGTTHRTDACTSHLITNQKPQATFACISLAASPKTGNAPLTVSFDAKGRATNAKVTSFKFVFDSGNGDTRTVNAVQQGSGVATAHTSFTYQNPGVTHNPFVLVNTTAGTTKKVGPCEATITTKPTTPPSFACTSLVGHPTSGDAPLKVNFKAMATASGTAIKSYNYNFDANKSNTIDLVNHTSANSNLASHTYTAPGNYTATVTVTTGAGTTQVISKCSVPITVKKSPQAPVFACDSLIGQPTSGVAPLTVKFTAKGSATRTNIVSYNYNFDSNLNNTIDLVNHTSSTTNTATHTYIAPGNYTATVTVTTGAGTTKVSSKCSVPITVKKSPQPPVFACLGLSAQPTSGEAPLTVKFTAKGSATRTNIVSYNYNFDANNNSSIDLVNHTSSTTNTASHTYTAPGNYKATVTVTTGAGTTKVSKLCSVLITVKKPPVNRNFACTGLTADQTSGAAPLTVNFVATASVNNTQVQRYLFDFGDSHTAQVKTSALSANISHTYQQDGDYLATVQVDTKAGTTATTEQCEIAIHVSTPPGQGGGGSTPPAETPPSNETPPVGEIPATGSGALGLAGFTGVGFLGYYFRKRNLLNLLG